MSAQTQQTPPKGDMDKAEKYIDQLISLINQNKIEVNHTDLTKFDPTSLKDHYTINLHAYQIEISHSNHESSNKESFVMIFNNLKHLSEGKGEKVILAYVYLTDSQFSKFKMVAERQLAEKRRVEEEKKFDEALEPIDKMLERASADKTLSELSQERVKDEPETSSDSYLNQRPVHQI